jgi:hypothetical protein
MTNSSIQNLIIPSVTNHKDTLLSASQVFIVMSVNTGYTLVLAQLLLQLQCGWVTVPTMCFMHTLAKWTKGH